jgi:hypothetical protein
MTPMHRLPAPVARPGLACAWVCWVAALAAPGPANAAEQADVEARLQAAPKAHPRLFFNQAAEAPLRQKIAADPLLAKALASVTAVADRMIGEPPVERTLIGRRLLDKSRRCLSRVIHLAFAHRLTGDRKYLDRARQEMLAAAAFSDWNPSHFLDVAEMTAALAIGYDWLHGGLDADARATIRTAIVEKGLKPSLQIRGGWTTGTNNWNQVCHGGMTLGALALLEDEPGLAAQILVRALDGLPHAMAEYKPDGAYPEGPGYWAYGTTYNVVLLDALESVLGTDFGLAGTEGFLKTPDYYLHVAGPTGLCFNYSDCGAGAGVSPAQFWFAARRKDPSLLWFEVKKLESLLARPVAKESDRFFPFLLLWSGPVAGVRPPAELHWTGKGTTPVSFHRSGWDDKAAFVAVKGGSPSASHAHMDIGTFVMDADGVRWAEDLGMQDYNSLESQGVKLWDGRQDGGRWDVFRLGPLSHSTLVVDGKRQLVKGRCPIAAFSKEGPFPHTVVDMTPVHEGSLARALRGIGLRPDRSVLVQDEIEAAGAKASVRWGMVTRAEVRIAGDRSAVLTKEGRTLGLTVLAPEGARLKIVPLDPPPAATDAPNKDAKLVAFEVSLEASAKERLAVLLTPGGTAPEQPPLKPLASW